MQNPYDAIEGKSSFWKRSEIVPGRPVHSSHFIRDSKSVSPKKNSSKSKHRKTSSSSSFQEFQDSTEDAWNTEDDDFCHSLDMHIHPRVAQSTAMKVLSNHSKGNFRSEDFCLQDKGKKQTSVFSNYAENRSDSIKNNNRREIQAISKSGASRFDQQLPNGFLHGPGIGVRQNTKKPSLLYSQKYSHSSKSSSERDAARLQSFEKLLNSPNTDLMELRKLSWSGIPVKVRPVTWKLLSDYLPTCLEKRESFLQRRKEEYKAFISRYYDSRNEDVHHETYRQIHIDVPRMSPFVPLFQQELVQQAFERILYILAIRHPASGYVQGMNDLVTPFYVVFLQDYIPADADVESYDISKLQAEILQQIEADSYWCMAKLLDDIQDNYTFAQPGIQKKVNLLKELIKRIDEPLHEHLKSHSIEYIQFTFRWMNNLLMRELPLSCTIRLWDTYLSETNGFSSFHLYVCAAFLKNFSKELLLQKDFQGLMLSLQNLPTHNWGDDEISMLVAEAYKLKYMFDDAPNHLQPGEK